MQKVKKVENDATAMTSGGLRGSSSGVLLGPLKAFEGLPASQGHIITAWVAAGATDVKQYLSRLLWGQVSQPNIYILWGSANWTAPETEMADQLGLKNFGQNLNDFFL